jgi:hypothetical protein
MKPLKVEQNDDGTLNVTLSTGQQLNCLTPVEAVEALEQEKQILLKQSSDIEKSAYLIREFYSLEGMTANTLKMLESLSSATLNKLKCVGYKDVFHLVDCINFNKFMMITLVCAYQIGKTDSKRI